METRASTREGARGARALAREEKLGTVRFRFSRTRDLQDRTEPGVSRVQTQRRARGERVADHFKSDFAREVASSARVVGRARAPSSARQIDLLRFLNDFFVPAQGNLQKESSKRIIGHLKGEAINVESEARVKNVRLKQVADTAAQAAR
jgi:hypothetical protein